MLSIPYLQAPYQGEKCNPNIVIWQWPVDLAPNCYLGRVYGWLGALYHTHRRISKEQR